MNIYVLRHGQTDYNIEGKFQGQIDIKMNKNGEEQTDKVALELNKINFDVIFSSPLKRTVNTAKKIKNENILIDNRIIERGFGTLEGKHGIPNYEDNIEKYNIEPIEKLTLRVNEFIEDVLKKYNMKENILIVTHEGIAQVINKYFNPQMKLKEFRLNTGEYKKYEFVEGRKI